MDTASGSMGWKSPKAALSLLGMMLITGVVVVAILQQRIINNPQWTVSVTGRGRIEYVPDTTNVTMGVRVDRAETGEAALARLNDAMDKVFSAVQEIGIPKEDISTQNYSLYPEYDYIDGKSELAGYSANQSITVKIKDVTEDSDTVSKVIEEASKAGANQIQGVAFETSRSDELKDQARLEAIVDARAKSETMAQALGVKLGKVVGWWENIIAGPDAPNPYYGEASMGKGGGGSPQTPAGTQEIITEVNINYRIK